MALGACQRIPTPPESIDDAWRFADAERIETLSWSPKTASAGQTLELRFRGSPGVRRGLVWGLVPGSASAWQHYPRIEATRWVSPRTVWGKAQGSDAVRFEIPASWQDKSATIIAFRRHQGQMIAVHAGPRFPSSDPPDQDAAKIAVLGVVELASRRRVYPAQKLPLGQLEMDGQLLDWPTDTPVYPLVASLDGGEVLHDKTFVAFAWDQEHLYVRAQMQDRDLWAPHTKRDDPLYRNEAIEIFVGADASSTDYLELGISAGAVIYDARYTRHRVGTRSYDGPWRYGVSVQGTLNQSKDRDRGWRLELALPWTHLCAMARVQCPVTAGTEIRVNVFRVESPRRRAQIGTAWVAPGRPDFHAMDQAAVLRLSP